MAKTPTNNIFTVKNGIKFGIGFTLARLFVVGIDRALDQAVRQLSREYLLKKNLIEE